MTGLTPAEYDRHASDITRNTSNYAELVKLRNEYATHTCWWVEHNDLAFAIAFAKQYANLHGLAQRAIYKLLLDPKAWRTVHNTDDRAVLS